MSDFWRVTGRTFSFRIYIFIWLLTFDWNTMILCFVRFRCIMSTTFTTLSDKDLVFWAIPDTLSLVQLEAFFASHAYCTIVCTFWASWCDSRAMFYLILIQEMSRLGLGANKLVLSSTFFACWMNILTSHTLVFIMVLTWACWAFLKALHWVLTGEQSFRAFVAWKLPWAEFEWEWVLCESITFITICITPGGSIKDEEDKETCDAKDEEQNVKPSHNSLPSFGFEHRNPSVRTFLPHVVESNSWFLKSNFPICMFFIYLRALVLQPCL